MEGVGVGVGDNQGIEESFLTFYILPDIIIAGMVLYLRLRILYAKSMYYTYLKMDSCSHSIVSCYPDRDKAYRS